MMKTMFGFGDCAQACATKANPCQRQRTRGSRLDKSTTRERVLLRHMSLLFPDGR
mgnify:CR=1 FL=1